MALPHHRILSAGLCLAALASIALAQPLPLVADIEAQPLAVHVGRQIEALDQLGQPIPPSTRERIREALAHDDERESTRALQEALDELCLVRVHINPEARVKVEPGPARRRLTQSGWTCFLIKVHNEAGSTAPLRAASPQSLPLPGAPASQVRDRWLDLEMFDSRPSTPTLSGLSLEYRILQLYSRDAGRRAAVLAFDVGQGTQDLGFRNDVTLTFACDAATQVPLRVLDENGRPTTASFVFRDRLGRVYPSQPKRLAPDFAFHPQVYRADGETVDLTAGEYTVTVARGPEYLSETRTVNISDRPDELVFRLERWIDPAASGWWSGDHHIHAAGCAHYSDPSQGVHAEDMYRQIVGEDLKVGANLTWGPCFDYQKEFFTGAVDPVSRHPYLLRYDVEVSGFGSHQSGHLCLLRLRDQIYPGGESSAHWPTLGLNTLRWAKAQGAVCGPAHSGFGLATRDGAIPSYEVPAFDGIGANEYIVDVTHEVPGPDGRLVPAVDFMSTVDTPAEWELPIWYHTLNCGFRTRISGETDFPCIYGERVGMGRSYVKLDGRLSYDDWCEGIRAGRAYVSDGNSHLLDFKVGDRGVGEKGSELRLPAPGRVTASATVAALLTPSATTGRLPAWHLEKSRLDGRAVPVELIVNGQSVARSEIVADGVAREVSFDVDIDRSSWVAIRILHSSHTNPVFVIVGERPIRASRRSAEWCLAAVEQCWTQKRRFYDADEMQDAIDAYAHARRTYRRILAGSHPDTR